MAASRDSRLLSPDQVRASLPFEPRRVSVGWPGGLVAERYRRLDPNELDLPPESHVRVTLQMAHTAGSRYRWAFGHRLGEGRWERPHLTVTPAGVPQRWAWDGVVESFHLSVPLDLIGDVAEAHGLRRNVTLLPVPGVVDLTAHNLLRVLERQLANGDGFNALLVEHVARALISHLVRHHAERARLGASVESIGLGPELRRVIEAAVRERLCADLDVATLATACGCSRRHLERAFPTTFGASPGVYLRRHRLEEAVRRLRQTDASVEAVARACGFTDAAHLRRTLRSHGYGAPNAIRRTGGC